MSGLLGCSSPALASDPPRATPTMARKPRKILPSGKCAAQELWRTSREFVLREMNCPPGCLDSQKYPDAGREDQQRQQTTKHLGGMEPVTHRQPHTADSTYLDFRECEPTGQTANTGRYPPKASSRPPKSSSVNPPAMPGSFSEQRTATFCASQPPLTSSRAVVMPELRIVESKARSGRVYVYMVHLF